MTHTVSVQTRRCRESLKGERTSANEVALKNARPAAEAAAMGSWRGAGQFLGSVHYVSLIVLVCTLF